MRLDSLEILYWRVHLIKNESQKAPKSQLADLCIEFYRPEFHFFCPWRSKSLLQALFFFSLFPSSPPLLPPLLPNNFLDGDRPGGGSMCVSPGHIDWYDACPTERGSDIYVGICVRPGLKLRRRYTFRYWPPLPPLPLSFSRLVWLSVTELHLGWNFSRCYGKIAKNRKKPQKERFYF